MKRIYLLLLIFLFSNLVFPVSYAQAKSEMKQKEIKMDLNFETSGEYKTYESQEIKTDFNFSFMAFKWKSLEEENKVEISARVRDKESWTAWKALSNEQDDFADSTGSFSESILANSADFFQFKVKVPAKTDISDFRIFYMNDSVVDDAENRIYLASASYSTAGRVRIISRQEWGADETYRVWNATRPTADIKPINKDYADKYSDELKVTKKIAVNANGQTLTWPQEYAVKVTKFIIHHTDSTSNLDDPKKSIRNIYAWHTFGRGWGDIGYNYLIDTNGNIYEGRAGGEGVVGAHAGRANTGSIGIAILGSYEKNDVPEKAILALSKLIAEKSSIHGIDPTGYSEFRGKTMPNVFGHKDVMATDCPGKFIYDKLGLIRQLSKQSIRTTYETSYFQRQKEKGYDFEDDSGIFYFNIDPNQTRRINISLKNTGKIAWDAGTTLAINNENGFKNKLTLTVQPTTSATYPGQTALFYTDVSAKYLEGLVDLQIAPLIAGKTKLEKYVQIPVNIAPPTFTYDVVNQNLPSGSMQSGTRFDAWVELRNTGNVPWFRSGFNIVKIGTDNPTDRKSLFIQPAGNRYGSLQQEKVNPGEIGRFNMSLVAPNEPGTYNEYFTPVVENVRWMDSQDLNFTVNVYKYPFDAQLYSISTRNIVEAEKELTIWVKLKNIGGQTWTKVGTNAISVEPMFSKLKLKSSRLVEASVEPGKVGTIEMTLTAPKMAIKYNYRFKVKAGASKLTRLPLSVPVTVKDAGSSMPVQQQQTVGSDYIRVLLGFSGNPVITSARDFSVYANNAIMANFSSGEAVSVEYVNGKYTVKANARTYTSDTPVKFVPGLGGILKISNYNHAPDWNASLNDNEYRGNLEVNYYNGALKTINEIQIEDYLKGIAEISNDVPAEKGKAILILARTYAKFYMGSARKFAGAPYDLDDNPDVSQKYLGYGYEKRSTNTAVLVDATRGMVVTYNGTLIKTPYFSTSDGRTRSAQEVWGWTDTPYLKSVPDTLCKAGKLSGHGVGLSGCGATEMAKLGKKAEEIIKYYFQGVEVKKLW